MVAGSRRWTAAEPRWNGHLKTTPPATTAGRSTAAAWAGDHKLVLHGSPPPRLAPPAGRGHTPPPASSPVQQGYDLCADLEIVWRRTAVRRWRTRRTDWSWSGESYSSSNTTRGQEGPEGQIGGQQNCMWIHHTPTGSSLSWRWSAAEPPGNGCRRMTPAAAAWAGNHKLAFVAPLRHPCAASSPSRRLRSYSATGLKIVWRTAGQRWGTRRKGWSWSGESYKSDNSARG